MVEVTYREVMDRVANAAFRKGRSLDSITVTAVSKGQPLEKIKALYDLGHRVFGENRAVELAEKAAQLPSDISWHFIGPLQTNKVRMVRPAVQLLQSMDRERLAHAWIKGPALPPPVLIQVNIGGESQKSGVDPAGVADMVQLVQQLGIGVEGLMSIPPRVDRPEESRRFFKHLAQLGREVSDIWPRATELSMGMSGDYEVAIEEGATIVRIGEAIFGAR